jgi:hypothetical protein
MRELRRHERVQLGETTRTTKAGITCSASSVVAITRDRVSAGYVVLRLNLKPSLRGVKAELDKNTRERDFVERESAIKIFEKVCGWVKTLAWVFACVMLPLAAVGIYKWSDLLSTINAGKQSVSSTASEARRDVAQTASSEREKIETTSAVAQKVVIEAASSVTREGRGVVQAGAAAKSEIARQTAQVRADFDQLNEQVNAASKLQPEMISIREELTRQQRVLSSTEEFARGVFKSHRVEFFQPDQTLSDRYKILARKKW